MKVLYYALIVIFVILAIALSPIWLPILLFFKIKGSIEFNREMRRLEKTEKPHKNNAAAEITTAENE